MTYIQKILEQYPEADTWQKQFPWFSVGHLVAAAKSKDCPEWEATAQRAAVFTNNIPRLHWLLHQPDWEKTDMLPVPEQQPQYSSIIDKASLVSITENQPSFHIDLSGPPDEEEAFSEEEENEETQTQTPPLSGSLAEAASSFKNETTNEDSLLFETAYQHTIDYFASQGIRLEGEPAQDDRFGQQLKTFTSWLRQMKRLPNTTAQEVDALVDTHAAHSLQQGDVLTESMVDVLVKQGKKQQAIQVLEKLRLLHPEKSLYFAARSEQIKHSK